MPSNGFDLIQLLVQAGGVGIAFYLIFTGRQERKEFTNLVSNHLKSEIESREKLTAALTELKSVITRKGSK